MSTPTALTTGWVEHLRAGGTTTWAQWAGPCTDASVPGAGGPLPGAAQLELLRLLNADGWPVARAGEVLGRAAPGRGPARLELPWPPRRHAAPDDEVLRVGAGVLADLTARLPHPADPARTREPHLPRRRRVPWRRTPTFVLDGLPVTVAGLRADLAAAGLHEHRPDRSRAPDLVLLVAGPADRALAEVWSRRTQAGAARPWARFVHRWAQRDALPPAAEAGRLAARWAARGAGRVRVLDAGSAALEAGRLLGVVPVGGAPRLPGDPRVLPAPLVDVVRRVNAVLPFVVPGEELAGRRAALVARAAAGVPAASVPVAVPGAERAWVDRAAARVEAELRALGHATPPLAPVHEGSGPRRGEVLQAMVRMIHTAADHTAAAEGAAP